MYASHLLRRLSELRRNVWKTLVFRSGTVLLVFFALLLLAVGIAWHERGRGKLTKLKTELAPSQPQVATSSVAPPGGQEPIVLQHRAIMGGTEPEFLSATLLPGMGMDVLQLTAYLPDRGEVNLLAAPSLPEVSQQALGKDSAELRAIALKAGGALEAPWTGRLSGAKSANGSVAVSWSGRTLTLPGTEGIADGGLLLGRRTDSVKQNVMPDGGDTQTVTTAGNFDGYWPSHTEVTTTVLLSSRSFTIRMVAKNVGTEPEPMGLGWRPRFAILSGDRANLTLKLPPAERIERSGQNGLPSGRLLPVEGSEYDFTRGNGARLGALRLDDTFVRLRSALLVDNPEIELRDPAQNYMLRMTTLTRSIHALHVVSPAASGPSDKPYIAIEPETEYDDAMGREWPKDEDTGVVVLQPGESMQWSVRLELFPLNHGASDSASGSSNPLLP